VLAEVELTDPKVKVLAAPPVAIFTVVAEASAEKLIAPTPEAIVIAPPVEIT
jgi:hypothetical protein